MSPGGGAFFFEKAFGNKVAKEKRSKMGVIDDIKGQADLLQYVEQFVKLKPESGGKRHRGKCPIHKEEKGESFFVFPTENRWRGYGKCGTGGTIIDF